MLSDKQVIEILNWSGHLHFPFGEPNQQLDPEINVEDLELESPEVRLAVESYQDFMRDPLEHITAAHHPERKSVAPKIDGIVGPSTMELFELPRCGQPDYTPEYNNSVATAVGAGNWKRCHGIGEFHAASVRILNNPPSFLSPVFQRVLMEVQQAYDEVGLRFYFDGRTPVNIDFSFVTSSSGWIGLAEVVNNASCTSRSIFCRYLATYRGGTSEAAIINQWRTLIKHELGHNCGMGHSSGGVMNPSIINGLPISWKNDASWSLLAHRFGGHPVTPTSPPPPGPDPNPKKYKYIIESDSPVTFSNGSEEEDPYRV